MTNREKFIEIFGYIPANDVFHCPEECPEEFGNAPFCNGCPFLDFGNAEYKEPEGV